MLVCFLYLTVYISVCGWSERSQCKAKAADQGLGGSTVDSIRRVDSGSRSIRRGGGGGGLAVAVETDADRLVEMLLWHWQWVVGALGAEHVTAAPDKLQEHTTQTQLHIQMLLGGSVVRALDSGPRGREFDSRRLRFRVARLNSAFHPSGVGKSSTGLHGWGKQHNTKTPESQYLQKH